MADKKLTAVKDPYSKAQVLSAIAADTGLSKKDVGAVFDSLADLIARHLKSRGPGVFTLPGLAKITVIKKAATKARKGVNPFTGEPTVFKAKPARRVVKLRALKSLKDLAAE
jgi:nucleoid DNA-binding protein